MTKQTQNKTSSNARQRKPGGKTNETASRPTLKGNSFWKLRSKHGRDKIFSSPEQFLKGAYEYFENCNKNPWYKNEVLKSGDRAGQVVQTPTQRPYSIEGLCNYLNFTEDTFRNYERDEKYKDFFEVFGHVRQIIRQNQIEGATVGAYNGNIIARILGLVDKQEHDLRGYNTLHVKMLKSDIPFAKSEEEIDTSNNPKNRKKK